MIKYSMISVVNFIYKTCLQIWFNMSNNKDWRPYFCMYYLQVKNTQFKYCRFIESVFRSFWVIPHPQSLVWNQVFWQVYQCLWMFWWGSSCQCFVPFPRWREHISSFSFPWPASFGLIKVILISVNIEEVVLFHNIRLLVSLARSREPGSL